MLGGKLVVIVIILTNYCVTTMILKLLPNKFDEIRHYESMVKILSQWISPVHKNNTPGVTTAVKTEVTAEVTTEVPIEVITEVTTEVTIKVTMKVTLVFSPLLALSWASS